MRGKRSPKIGDFKPGVLLQPLNITALLLQDKEAKLKRWRCTMLCVSSDKSWWWSFEDSGWSNPADFFGKPLSCLALRQMWMSGQMLQSDSSSLGVESSWTPRYLWDSAPHWLRLHRRCRSCCLPSKTQNSRAMEGPQKFPYTVTSVTSCWDHRVSAGCCPFQPILWRINQASSTAILQKGHHKQFSKNCADITRNFI